ncbi:hypothetical protein FB45DRAFT_1060801 [Roridomyces roridus]|uniref:AMP-dependent synthetase/ligase domain-containing protein n=1 Tax=Roridomyces roridus TaxID=1738132 RepID=A0AAD7FKK8_9AGAR|nr:hypothetical protein FB45DRAFT_1060801 [Roridomyces roridus]
MPPSQTLETLPGLISRNLENCPLDPFCIYAESGHLVTITQLEFGRATHRAAHLLRPNRQGQDWKVVAIIAESDTILYHAVLAGLLTAGLTPFPISQRNSPPAIYQLLRATSCHHIIATRVTLAPILARLAQHIADVDPGFTLTIEEIPPLRQVYPNLGCETLDCAFHAYPALDIQPTGDDVIMYLHSSGSTGFPKAIAWTYRLLTHSFAVSAIDVRACVPTPKSVMGMPPFHLMGIFAQMVRPLYGMVAAVYPRRLQHLKPSP